MRLRGRAIESSDFTPMEDARKAQAQRRTDFIEWG